jgi:hypothetical protein
MTAERVARRSATKFIRIRISSSHGQEAARYGASKEGDHKGRPYEIDMA